MNLKAIEARLSQVEARRQESRLVVQYEGETLEQCLERNGISEGHPRDRLTVLKVVYEEPPVADA